MLKFLPKISLDSAMYPVVLLLAFAVPLSTAAASIAVGIGTLFIIVWSVRHKSLPPFDSRILEILAVYLVLQAFIAAMSWEPWNSFREFFGEIHRFFPLIFAMTFIKKREQLCGVLIASMAAFLINDAAGIYQYFIQGQSRAIGFNHTPTFYGSFMLMQIPLLIYITQLEILSPLWRKIAIFAAMLSAGCLILSMTRGAWLSFIMVVVVFVVLEKKYRLITAKICAGLAVVFLIGALISPQMQERLDTFTNTRFQSNTERVLMWKAAAEMFYDYPIYGVGQKMFFNAYNHYYITHESREHPAPGRRGHTHPHNNFLHRASEGGIIGLASFIGLYAYFFWKFFTQLKREKNFAFGAGMTAFLILAGLQFEGLTDTNMNQVPIMREFWLLAGTLIAAENILLGNRK
ncbi:MAG: O-antigen ligase family protein [Selenomonadaceae bacterium]|nr:O-antigen ligase family protein [Selenomonadaceae bacterium]